MSFFFNKPFCFHFSLNFFITSLNYIFSLILHPSPLLVVFLSPFFDYNYPFPLFIININKNLTFTCSWQRFKFSFETNDKNLRVKARRKQEIIVCLSSLDKFGEKSSVTFRNRKTTWKIFLKKRLTIRHFRQEKQVLWEKGTKKECKALMPKKLAIEVIFKLEKNSSENERGRERRKSSKGRIK